MLKLEAVPGLLEWQQIPFVCTQRWPISFPPKNVISSNIGACHKCIDLLQFSTTFRVYAKYVIILCVDIIIINIVDSHYLFYIYEHVVLVNIIGQQGCISIERRKLGCQLLLNGIIIDAVNLFFFSSCSFPIFTVEQLASVSIYSISTSVKRECWPASETTE